MQILETSAVFAWSTLEKCSAMSAVSARSTLEKCSAVFALSTLDLEKERGALPTGALPTGALPRRAIRTFPMFLMCARTCVGSLAEPSMGDGEDLADVLHVVNVNDDVPS